MKKNVFYVNVLRIEKGRKIDIKNVLNRLNSISNLVKEIDEISNMVKKKAEKGR